MFDLESFIVEKGLKDNNELVAKSFSRKELKDLGLTDYYLSKAVAEKKIEKVARGVYKWVVLEKIKSSSPEQVNDSESEKEILTEENMQLDASLEETNLVPTADELIKSEKYLEVYNLFFSNYRENKWEEALYYLKVARNYANGLQKQACDILINLLSDYLKGCVHSADILEEDYSLFGNNSKLIFNRAVLIKDYLQAYHHIDGGVEVLGTKENLEICRDLLGRITILPINIKKKEVEEDQLELTDMDIYDLVLNREYAVLNRVLQKKYDEAKLYRVILKLIRAKEKISCLIIPTVSNVKYQSNDYDNFGRFFEALRYLDYEEAYRVVSKCEEAATRKNRNALDFKIYALLLKDILVELEVAKEKIQQQKFKESIDKNLKDFIYQRDFDDQGLDELWDLIVDKLEYYPQGEEKYLKPALNLIESIWLVSDNKIPKDYYGAVTCDEVSLIDKFFYLLQYGDYNSCYEIINTRDWQLNSKNFHLKKYLVLYKKLLFKFNRSLAKGQESFEVTGYYGANLNDVSKFLEVLRFLIANDCYEEAYMYYVGGRNNFEVSESLGKDLDLFFGGFACNTERKANLNNESVITRTLSKED